MHHCWVFRDVCGEIYVHGPATFFVLWTARKRKRCDGTISAVIILKFVSEANNDNTRVCRAVLGPFPTNTERRAHNLDQSCLQYEAGNVS